MSDEPKTYSYTIGNWCELHDQYGSHTLEARDAGDITAEWPDLFWMQIKRESKAEIERLTRDLATARELLREANEKIDKLEQEIIHLESQVDGG